MLRLVIALTKPLLLPVPVPDRSANVRNILARIRSFFGSGGRVVVRKVDLSHRVYQLVFLTVLLAATRVRGAKSSLVRFLAVTSLATLMTRWWLFRACNNPAPADNSCPSTGEDGAFIGCSSHECKKSGAKGLRCASKCGSSPSRTNTTTSATTIITPTATTSTTSQHSSQTCESQSSLLYVPTVVRCVHNRFRIESFVWFPNNLILLLLCWWSLLHVKCAKVFTWLVVYYSADPSTSCPPVFLLPPLNNVIVLCAAIQCQ